jgi:hypothetical protein
MLVRERNAFRSLSAERPLRAVGLQKEVPCTQSGQQGTGGDRRSRPVLLGDLHLLCLRFFAHTSVKSRR